MAKKSTRYWKNMDGDLISYYEPSVHTESFGYRQIEGTEFQCKLSKIWFIKVEEIQRRIL